MGLTLHDSLDQNIEVLDMDTWRSNSKKLAYMSSKVQEIYPQIPEDIIFDYAEGTWPADWDEAAQELINELGATNWVESFDADTYWNPESDYDEGAAGMVGIVGIAALTLFTLAIAKGIAAGKKL